MMKLTQSQLRRLLEAEVDKMRLPRGPNTRDDSEDLNEVDGELDSPQAMLSTARDLEGYVNEIYDDMESSESGAEVGQKTVNALNRMQMIIDNMIRHYSMLV